jgi:uncharacterized protein (DUF1800 family)
VDIIQGMAGRVGRARLAACWPGDSAMALSRRDFLKSVSAVVASGQGLQWGENPWRLADKTALGLSTAAPPSTEAIIMNRMAFGPRPDYLAEIAAAGGIDAYVEQQLDPASIADTDCDARLAAFNFGTLGLSLSQLWAYRNMSSAQSRIPLYETRTATWLRAVYSRRQLLEVLADFWHNHFNVYGQQSYIRSVFVHYDRDVIRAHALGNFRVMLEAVATSTAMQYYLDNVYSADSGPNENYARELFELHTLGAEVYHPEYTIDTVPADFYANHTGYIDSDVYEAARAFTGWSVANGDSQSGGLNDGTFKYKADWHDRFQKQVLGHQIPNDQPALKDGDDVLSWVAEHPATATHLAAKLCRRLIADGPPANVAAAAAATFLANTSAPDQIEQTVRTILYSNEFRTSWGQKVKRPFEHVVSALRAVSPANSAVLAPRTDYSVSDPFFSSYNAIGQPLFEWIPPTGYPDAAPYWLNSNSLLKCWNFFMYACEPSSSNPPWSRVSGIRFDLKAEMPVDRATPNQIVDFWIDRLLRRAIDPADRAALVEFAAQGADPDAALTQTQIDLRIRGLAALIFASPYFLER